MERCPGIYVSAYVWAPWGRHGWIPGQVIAQHYYSGYVDIFGNKRTWLQLIRFVDMRPRDLLALGEDRPTPRP